MTNKLYIWSGLTDCTSGVLFAVATSPELARRKIMRLTTDDGPLNYSADRVAEDIGGEPDQCLPIASAAGYCYGGG